MKVFRFMLRDEFEQFNKRGGKFDKFEASEYCISEYDNKSFQIIKYTVSDFYYAKNII